jgi:hypothetical protein
MYEILPCQVVEHGLGHLPFTEKQVITPTGILQVAPYILLPLSSSPYLFMLSSVPSRIFDF